MTPTPIEAIAAFIFALALLHTLLAKQFERLSHRFPRHAGIFHLLGEVEVVFGFWAIVMVATMALAADGATALRYVNERNYTEPCSSSPSWWSRPPGPSCRRCLC